MFLVAHRTVVAVVVVVVVVVVFFVFFFVFFCFFCFFCFFFSCWEMYMCNICANKKQSMVENNVGVPAGAVLISPFSDLSRSLPAHVRNRDKDVLLSPELMDTFSKHIKSANKLPLAHPSMSPLFASFDDLPPLLFTG